MRSPFRILPGSILAAVCLWLLPAPAVVGQNPAPLPLRPEQIQRSIDKARDWLLKQQKADGSWPSARMPFPVGTTALTMLALANAGVDADNLNMRRALQWLRTQEPKDTYSVALQTMVLAMLAPDADRKIIQRNAEWLERMQIRSPNRQQGNDGAWHYGDRGGAGDPSNSQFALLALHEASRAGIRVRDETWKQAQQYWADLANADGSWGYMAGQPGTGSMTCAGISSLWITTEHVGLPDARAQQESVSCCGGGSSPKLIERGLDWLGKRFSVRQNPGVGGGGWLFYYIYGMERVGRFTARRFIGEHDWYLEGAGMLVETQDDLTGRFVAPGVEEPLVATSFALLFLAKGRRPVIVAKSRHEPAADWNRHGHDIAHLVEYVEGRWRKDYPAGLSWHVVDSPSASVADLLQ
ncbi:MAG: prenyltransferase/squalene oxidase repeat-containing protein, partial [Planctomycetia bacterium]